MTTTTSTWTPLPDAITALTPDEMQARIVAAKQKLGSDVLILGHHYQREEVFRHADFSGDSLKLSRQAAASNAEYIEDEVSFISSLDPDSNAARRLESGINPEDIDNYLLEVDKPLVLPAKTKIKFLITADDVIHSWWVPALGWKRDAIPGFINEAWTEIMEPGVYRGQCAELCGKDHGFMPIVLNVLPRDEYAAWVSQQKQDEAGRLAAN